MFVDVGGKQIEILECPSCHKDGKVTILNRRKISNFVITRHLACRCSLCGMQGARTVCPEKENLEPYKCDDSYVLQTVANWNKLKR